MIYNEFYIYVLGTSTGDLRVNNHY